MSPAIEVPLGGGRPKRHVRTTTAREFQLGWLGTLKTRQSDRVSRNDCTCFVVREHLGPDAVEYAEKHLRCVRRFDGGFRAEYVCPEYGKGWLLDHVGATPHGGPTDAQVRLRTLDDVVRAIQSALINVEVVLDDADAVAGARSLSTRLAAASDPPRI